MLRVFGNGKIVDDVRYHKFRDETRGIIRFRVLSKRRIYNGEIETDTISVGIFTGSDSKLIPTDNGGLKPGMSVAFHGRLQRDTWEAEDGMRSVWNVYVFEDAIEILSNGLPLDSEDGIIREADGESAKTPLPESNNEGPKDTAPPANEERPTDDDEPPF